MNIREAFATQIANGISCDGNYLGERTYEEALEDITTTRVRNPVEHLNNKIEEWKEHEGEMLFYFIGYPKQYPNTPYRIEILRVWSSTLDDLSYEWKIFEDAEPNVGSVQPPAHFPRLIRK